MTATHAHALSVSADFDSGRVRVDSLDPVNRIVRTGIPADNHSQDARMRYWHYRLDGLTPGQPVTIQHNPSQNMHYVYSYDGEEWHRFPTAGISNLTFAFTQTSVYIAPNIAYPYSRSLALATELANSAYAEVSELAMSEEGRPIKMFRLSDHSVPDHDKRVVWFIGRQHAFESPSSFLPEGFARWMVSDDPAAEQFRRKVIAYVVPIMDVDNVFNGMTGKDQPDDFNRVWHRDPAPWNAIQAARAAMHASALNNRFLAVIDSHNPYYTQSPHWHVSARNAAWQNFATRFQQGIQAAGGTNWHNNTVQTMDQNMNPNDTAVLRRYAARHFGAAEDFISATMESAHHRDSNGKFMEKQGYLEWGEAIGRALNQLLPDSGEPPPPPPPPPHSPKTLEVLLDFGAHGPAPDHGGTWNSIAAQAASGTVSNIWQVNGAVAEGISLVYNGFSSTTTNQGNWPHGTIAWVDSRATADYFWSGSAATLTLKGLPSGQTYQLELVSARNGGTNRAGDIRIQNEYTQFDVSSFGYDANIHGWQQGYILRWQAIAPDSNGDIVIQLVPRDNQTIFLNAMRIVAYTPVNNGSYADWRLSHFGTNSADQSVGDPYDIPLHDGVTNLMKYALDLNPHEQLPTG
ncbi:MAG: M14-type cytosolic carboxypeptidase [Verrucomicrobia bacterium]|nr:M14-type cytosolic carboxypeptidase [Verrucomicrobiota bacterium]